MKKLREWAIFSLFPRHCACCDKLIAGDRFFCDECLEKLPRIEGVICPSCGRGKKECACGHKANYYNSIASPFYFEGELRKGIHRFKFRSAVSNSKAYAAEMAKTIGERFEGVQFDYITEVPIGRNSLRERGFNQCALLAKEISQITGIPYRPGILKKIYETEKQHGLNYYLRRGNLTGIYDSDYPGEIKDKVILLCDDVSTSGETFNECSKMLWLYGAKEIHCICAALTKKRGDK